MIDVIKNYSLRGLKIKGPVILASLSPRRIELLKRWGVKFRIIPSRINEETELKRPSSIVKQLSLKKAYEVSKNIHKGLVIGADTIVVFKGKIIGKPDSRRDAEKILSSLNGSFHKVYTGIALVNAATGENIVDYEVSRVKLRCLDLSRIRELSGKHLDKAGAYAVQEKSDAFVESIEGDYYNVVGLPFLKLEKLLKKFIKKLNL